MAFVQPVDLVQYSATGAKVFQANRQVSVTATEDLTAGNLVNLYNSSGLKVRKANATDATKPADGFVKVDVANGEEVLVQTLDGYANNNSSGLTVGTDYYLSTTGGAVTATAPSTSGNIMQRVGKAVSSTSYIYERGIPITI